MELELHHLIKDLKLEKHVHLKKYISQDEVRLQMERSHIFLFTSDFNEGWGAVLGEAMSSGCAVVASHACGSSPFLIKDGINGFLYQNGNEEDLFIKTKALFNSPELRYSMGKQAFHDMRSLWDAKVAAQRLITLSEHLNSKNDSSFPFSDGPCSFAPIVKNNFYSSSLHEA